MLDDKLDDFLSIVRYLELENLREQYKEHVFFHDGVERVNLDERMDAEIHHSIVQGIL